MGVPCAVGVAGFLESLVLLAGNECVVWPPLLLFWLDPYGKYLWNGNLATFN